MTELTPPPDAAIQDVKTVSVVGSGPVARELANQIAERGHAVTYLTADSDSTAESTPTANSVDCSVDSVAADPTLSRELTAAGVGDADVVLVATGSDATNFLAARIALTSGAARTVALVEDPELSEAIVAGDVETVSVPRVLGRAVVERLDG